jgi:threonine/homoserine efflux transporter RhtA
VSRRALTVLVWVSFVAGLALMVPFSSSVTRVLGIACLFAFVAGGLFLAADPAFLAADDE